MKKNGLYFIFLSGMFILGACAQKNIPANKSAYKLQLSVRVDEKRHALIYDYFEYKGHALAVSDPLPSKRSLRRFKKALDMPGELHIYFMTQGKWRASRLKVCQIAE